MTITSPGNARIKAVARLRQARARARAGATLAEGFQVLRRAVTAGYPLAELYVCRELFLGENEEDLIAAAAGAGTEVVEVAAEPFRKLAYYDRPDGLLAVMPIRRRALDGHRPAAASFYLAAEGLERPGNLGTILRSVDAAGAAALVLCDAGTDPFHPEAVRASVGTVFSVPCFEAESRAALAWAGRHRLRTVAASAHATTPYTAAALEGAVLLAVGAERHGLSATWLEGADERVTIPMHGTVSSLNVGTAATLLLYEARRQRTPAG
jgi:TrmH family RNA methyltransferase